MEVRWHLKVCQSCRKDFQLLGDVKAAMRGEDLVVPPHWNARALEAIREEARKEASERWSVGKRWIVAATLGALTTGTAMLMVGTLGHGALGPSLLVMLCAGATIGAAEVRWAAKSGGPRDIAAV